MFVLLLDLFVFCLYNIYVISRAFVLFFFQAEDGIRDLVRSRGLGDVYKRQLPLLSDESRGACPGARRRRGRSFLDLRQLRAGLAALSPVSYTHLTLPTSDLV